MRSPPKGAPLVGTPGLVCCCPVGGQREDGTVRRAARLMLPILYLRGGVMVDGQSLGSGLVYKLERVTAARAKARRAELAPGWRGRVSDLDGDAVKAFWAEAVRYARWEIGRYGRWREQDEPVLAGGYDAEGVVQAAFERLMQREAGSTAVEPRNLPIKSLLSPSVAKPLEGRPALSSTGREGAA